MKWIDLIITRISRFGTGAAFLLLITAVLIQVVGRTMGASPVWTEELTRYALLYMVAFGAGLSLRSRDLVNVDLVCESLPGAWPSRLRLVSYVFVAGLCVILYEPATRFMSIGKMQTSPALGMRMDIAHGSIVVLLVVLLLFALLGFLSAFRAPDGEADPEASLDHRESD